MLTGGCHCGAVRFEVDEIFDAGYCHCSICQRISGAPAVAWANLPARAFRLTAGEPRAFASSERYTRYFCPDCSSPVYGRHPRPSADDSDLVCVHIPNFDDPSAVRPSVHVWYSAHLPWFETADDLLRVDAGELAHPEKRGAQPRGEPS